MKKQIRNEVFESNSSSVHTLTISKSGREPSKFIPDKEGYIHVDYGQFGKEHEIYSSQYDKLSYLITLCYYCAGRYGNAADSYQFERIEEAVKNYTGCNGIIIDDIEEPYIDHQSAPWEEGIDIIDVYDEDSVIDFIFNSYISLKTYCD